MAPGLAAEYGVLVLRRGWRGRRRRGRGERGHWQRQRERRAAHGAGRGHEQRVVLPVRGVRAAGAGAAAGGVPGGLLAPARVLRLGSRLGLLRAAAAAEQRAERFRSAR